MKLIDFLLSLITDAQKLAAFRRDPDEVINKSGLSPKEKAAVKRGDVKKLQSLVGSQAGPNAHPPIIIVWPKPTPRPNGHKPTPPKPKPKPATKQRRTSKSRTRS